MKAFYGLILGVSVILWSISGCKLKPNEVGLPNYNAEILGPIVTGSYTGSDFISDNSQISTVDPQGLVTLAYRGDIPTLGIEDYLLLPNQSFPIGAVIPPGTTPTLTFTHAFSLNIPNGAQLTELDLRSGYFGLNLISTSSAQINCSFRFINATRPNSQPVILNINLPPGGSTRDSVMLTDAIIDLTNGSVGTYNALAVEFTYTSIGGNLNFNNVLAGSSFFLSNFKPGFAKGYLGTYSDSLKGTFSIPIFERFYSGQLQFESPYLSTTLSNSFGVGMAFPNSPTSVFISGKNNNRDPNDSVMIGAAFRGRTVNPCPSRTSPPAITTIRVDGVQDNFPAFISLFPSQIRYNLGLTVNPNSVGNYNQFISDTSKFGGQFEFGLPLSFQANNLTISDTLPFKMLGDSSLAKIVDGKLITFVNNGLPVEFYFQAYFLDENQIIRDSLFESQRYVNPANISPDGRISTPSRQEFTTVLDIFKADKVKAMRYIRPVFSVRSVPAGGFVKIYNDFTLQFKVVGDLRFNLLSETGN